MNERPLHNESSKFQGTESHIDIWNDPDLVPPPVVMLDEIEEDQQHEYGYDDNYPHVAVS